MSKGIPLDIFFGKSSTLTETTQQKQPKRKKRIRIKPKPVPKKVKTTTPVEDGIIEDDMTMDDIERDMTMGNEVNKSKRGVVTTFGQSTTSGQSTTFGQSTTTFGQVSTESTKTHIDQVSTNTQEKGVSYNERYGIVLVNKELKRHDPIKVIRGWYKGYLGTVNFVFPHRKSDNRIWINVNATGHVFMTVKENVRYVLYNI